MGMIYRAEMIGDRAEVDFTLTYPGCPIGEEIEEEIRSILNVRSGAKEIVARMVWTPRWTEDRMSEELRLEYGYPV
jgi:metal-sulfur cluster biosynthetic enzyme